MGVFGQELGHRQGVCNVSFHAQFQGFQAHQEKKRVEGTERRAEIAQAFHASLHDEREIAECFVKSDAVIALAGLEQLRKRAAVPGKSSAVYNHAADGCSVSADKLCGRVQHNVRAMFDRAAEIRRCEGIVDHQRYPSVMRNLRHR